MRMAAAALALFAAGCGTLVHGPDDALFVDSHPAGATASIECERNFRTSGTTPVKLVFPRRLSGCALSVTSAGYRPERVELDQGFSGWFWANFAVGPLAAAAVRTAQGGGDLSGGEIAALLSSGVFFLVDQIGGAKHDYEPREIIINLERSP